MSDIPVYMIVNLSITDKEEYLKYEKGFFPILKRFGGEFVTYDDSPLTFEGSSPVEGRSIIFKFPSERAAKDWYADSDYQSLSEFRRSGTVLKHLTMVRGLPPRA
jgi:uncharacterized protein (DUF1330 family)